MIPSVSEAKRIAKTHGLRRCVILFELPDSRVGYSSYGKTRALCRTTHEIMDEFIERLEKRFDEYTGEYMDR